MTNDEPSSSVFRPSSMRLVDTHCHLDWNAFDADRDEVIRRAMEAGVTRMVTIGVDVASSRRAIELAERYSSVYAGVGVHPNDAADFNGDTLGEIRALAQHPKVVAIGEIGLDNYWKTVAPDAQVVAFRSQLELAADIGKPVIVHSREAGGDVLSILARYASGAARLAGILHAFSGDMEAAQRAFGLGFLIGFGGPVTYQKADRLREVVRAAPPDRFVIETDAPFLTPMPYRGQRNEPRHAKLVAEQIAQVRQAAVGDIARHTTANAARLFGWVDE